LPGETVKGQFLAHRKSKASDKVHGDAPVSFQDYQYALNSSEVLYECSTKLVTLNKGEEQRYRMFILEFLKFGNSKIQYEDLLNTEIVQREPNYVLFSYKTMASMIFFAFSVINLFIYALKVYRLEYKQIGFLKRLIFLNLMVLVIYNFVYSFNN